VQAGVVRVEISEPAAVLPLSRRSLPGEETAGWGPFVREGGQCDVVAAISIALDELSHLPRIILMRIIRLTSVLLPLALAACAGGRSEPPRSPAPAQSEILWDTWGVPHVYGRTAEDVGYGYGWAQAHLHGDAILRLYGLARGRGAEYWGERYAASDRLMRAMEVPGAGREGYEAQDDDFRRYLDAFAAGVNAYAAAHPAAIDDAVEAVLPVTGADLVAHTHRAMFTFLALTGGNPPLVGMDGMPAGAAPGSNAWAIAPRRSASGNAMLLANPHLPWNEPLMRFTEAHLVGPGLDVSGVTLIGLPVVAIGFNDRLGWSHTVNTIDAMDVFTLRLAEGGYRMDGEVRPFETRVDSIRVRQQDGTLRVEEITIRSSVHGPVVSSNDTTAIAIAVEGLDQHGGLRQWWEMGRARSLGEFEDALRRLQVPMFNVVYADRAGHVLYVFNGRVPVRGQRTFAEAQGFVRGDTSATLWRGVHGYDDLPRIVDPTAGFVQNSNSPPWFATRPTPLDTARYPAYLAPRWVGLREQRALHMLAADSSITYDELLAMRHSNHMLLADRVLDERIPAARATGRPLAMEAADVLERWDRAADAESRGAMLFMQWAYRTFESIPETGRGFARPWSPSDPIRTPDGLADPAAAVATLEQVAQLMNARMGGMDAPWGQLNRIGEFPANGAPGDPLGVFHVIAYAQGGDAAQAVFGDTYVAAVEFTPGGPRALAVLSYGNSSQPHSPHSNDQLRLIAEKRMRPSWRTRADVEANLESRTPIERTP
jgi:acyl-homoserine-lactone acylase